MSYNIDGIFCPAAFHPTSRLGREIVDVLHKHGSLRARDIHEELRVRNAPVVSPSDTLLLTRMLVDSGYVERCFPFGYRLTADGAAGL